MNGFTAEKSDVLSALNDRSIKHSIMSIQLISTF